MSLKECCFILPIIGSAFKKIYYDASLDRPCSEFVPIDQFYVSYHASDLMKADRYTHVILRNPNDLAKEIAAGVYEDIELPEAQPIEQTSMSMKVDEIMGTAIPADSDPQYVLLEQHCYLDLDDSGIGLPYIVTVEESSKKFYLLEETIMKMTQLNKRKCSLHITSLFQVLVSMV